MSAVVNACSKYKFEKTVCILKAFSCKILGIDPCLNSNGLCGKNAVCQKTTPGQHKCVCRQGYTGDGVICSGKNLLTL